MQKNADDLNLSIQEYKAAKQSLNRMSERLRKLCKRLTPTNEVVLEMQRISVEIKDLAKQATANI